MEHVLHEMKPALQRSVVAITGIRVGDPIMRVYGTGTLFRVAECSFLVTAAHVMQQYARNECELYISDLGGNDGGDRAVPLWGHAIQYSDARLDVGLLELPPDVESAIPHRRFLNLANVDLQRNIRPGMFALFGYPVETCPPDAPIRTIRLAPFTFLTGLYSGATEGLADYHPDLHFLLHIPRENTTTLEGSSKPRPDKFFGMSGCSLWRICSADDNLARWCPDCAKVVGVQRSAYNEGKQRHTIVKGIRWAAVAAILWITYPDLRPAMRVSHPDLDDELPQLASLVSSLS